MDTLFSRYKTLGFPELAVLPVDAAAKIDEFYRELDEFRLYLQFTEDMPTSMSDAYRWQLTRLQAYAEQAVESLGGTPERPLLDFPDEVDVEPERPLLTIARFEENPEGEE